VRRFGLDSIWPQPPRRVGAHETVLAARLAIRAIDVEYPDHLDDLTPPARERAIMDARSTASAAGARILDGAEAKLRADLEHVRSSATGMAEGEKPRPTSRASRRPWRSRRGSPGWSAPARSTGRTKPRCTGHSCLRLVDDAVQHGDRALFDVFRREVALRTAPPDAAALQRLLADLDDHEVALMRPLEVAGREMIAELENGEMCLDHALAVARRETSMTWSVEPRHDGGWAVQRDVSKRADSLHNGKPAAISRGVELGTRHRGQLRIQGHAP